MRNLEYTADDAVELVDKLIWDDIMLIGKVPDEIYIPAEVYAHLFFKDLLTHVVHNPHEMVFTYRDVVVFIGEEA